MVLLAILLHFVTDKTERFDSDKVQVSGKSEIMSIMTDVSCMLTDLIFSDADAIYGVTVKTDTSEVTKVIMSDK